MVSASTEEPKRGEVHEVVFVAWKVFQRRVEALEDRLGAESVFFHYAWEERSRFHKALSYPCKCFQTLRTLRRHKPKLVYVQAPPTFAIYAVWFYCSLARVPYVVDAHNPMIYDSFWPRLPLARTMLRRAAAVLVHNPYVLARAQELGLSPANLRVLMSRPLEVELRDSESSPESKVGLDRPQVVIPCSFDLDEPLAEIYEVTRLLPEVDFFITWYVEKLPPDFVKQFGTNTVFTGFLPLNEYNGLLARADIVVALTTRDGTQPAVASEALAFGRPLVASDWQTIRDLFPQGTVYVENRAPAIADGIRTALRQQEQLASAMKAFKPEKLRLWEKQFKGVQTLLDAHLDAPCR